LPIDEPRTIGVQVTMVRVAAIVALPLIGTGLFAQQPASTEDLWAPFRSTEIRRCDPDSAQAKQGQAALKALAVRVAALADHASPQPVISELRALLKSDCFRFAMESPRLPDPDTALSLKRWWHDGGETWLRGYLAVQEYGDVRALRHHITLPPDARRTLRLESGPERLSGLLCSLKDKECAADTRGWRTRAESFIEAHRVQERMRNADLDPAPSDAAHTASRCERDVADVTTAARYSAWRDCLEAHRPIQWSLPLGRLKAPSDGWLIVFGRRGHYNFCDGIGAYDLGTGSAYIYESCSGLALVADGQVDSDATHRGARRRAVAGRLRIENLREAAWALLLVKEAEEVQETAEAYPLPQGLEPVLRPHTRQESISWSRSMWTNTAQTRLQWRWVRSGGTVVGGDITWPMSWNAVEEHAALTLKVAEESLVEGCPPSAPPPPDIGDLSIAVHGADAVPQMEQELIEGFRQWRATPPCPSRRTPERGLDPGR
jgi:hypothetical protein